MFEGGGSVSQSPATRPAPAAGTVIAVINGYRRWISPLLVPRCRFYPTCSSYAATALNEYGLVRGGWLALKRLIRCQPFSPGGVDYVPSPKIDGRLRVEG
jgi:putative membrane protein insertion efficiency factor